MNIYLLIFMFVVGYFILWVTQARKLEKQLHVRYSREDDTIIEKFADVKDRYVFIDGKKFSIIPDCIRRMNWKRGIFFLVHYTISTISFTWNSPIPIDPDTGQIFIMSPAVLEAMDTEAEMLAFQRAGRSERKLEKRDSFLQKYGAIITIFLVVVVAIYLWMQIRGLDSSITLLGEYYKKLAGIK